MDLSLCHIALRVAETGSFAAAARHLDVAPSSVSRSVATLENHLGLRLFQRSTRVLILTEEGRLFLDRIAPLLESFQQAQEDARTLHQAPRGTVRITASVAFGTECLVPVLPEMQKVLPGVAVDLVLTDEPINLLENSIDLAIRLAPAPKADLISTRLMATRYHVCAAPDYVQTHGAPNAPADLSAQDCLLYALPGFGDNWRFRDPLGQETEYSMGGKLRISNALALRHAARLGCGPALLADWLVGQDLRNGTLVDLFPDHEVTATSFETGAWILFPSRRYLPVKTRMVIDFLKENLVR